LTTRRATLFSRARFLDAMRFHLLNHPSMPGLQSRLPQRGELDSKT
jgi:hypothetical protein